jgi:Icc-related predicted phosphoesterase
MVRIVAMADTHGFHADLAVPEGDVLIHAGDLTQHGTLPELEAVRDWLRSLPHRHKVLIAGNHDFAFERKAAEARALFQEFTYLEDELAVVAGLRIWGSPWQPWFHSWAFNLHRGPDIDAQWQRIPAGLDVLVTHGPPAGAGDLVWGEERVGCVDLRRHLARTAPRFHLFGHIHEDRGRWRVHRTECLNVTTSECTLPCTVFDVPVS